jgi:hypothetical protein
MKPPICEICNQRFVPPEGGLVTFVPTDEDKKILEKFKKPGYIGHPPNKLWFCALHYDAAKA